MRTQLLPSQEGHSSPAQFSVNVYCGQTAEWIKMPLGMEVGLDPGDIVLDGDLAPSTEIGTAAAHSSVHVYCGEMVARLSNC